jgi:hypothetical protein
MGQKRDLKTGWAVEWNILGGGGLGGRDIEKYEQNCSWITSNERDHLGNLGIGDSALKWVLTTGVNSSHSGQEPQWAQIMNLRGSIQC